MQKILELKHPRIAENIILSEINQMRPEGKPDKKCAVGTVAAKKMEGVGVLMHIERR